MVIVFYTATNNKSVVFYAEKRDLDDINGHEKPLKHRNSVVFHQTRENIAFLWQNWR